MATNRSRAAKPRTKPRTAKPRPPKAGGPEMPRYAAFLRGVSPMNCSMPELKKCFEAAGFDDVKTVLSSGNVLFSHRAMSEASLAAKAEAALKTHMGRAFPVIVRSVESLRKILAANPYRRFRLGPGSKRVVTFLKTAPRSKLSLPIEKDGARILYVKGSEAFTAYVQSPRGAAFMTLIEKTFGKDVTTRTWETVEKVAR